MAVNTDLIYNVLRRHEPGHVLLRAIPADAARGLIDLDRIPPLAIPVLLQIGREQVSGSAFDDLIAEAMPTAQSEQPL